MHITQQVHHAQLYGSRHVLGLQALIKEGKLGQLQQMYKEWPFFSVTLDMIEMVFAKADPRVAQVRCPGPRKGDPCMENPPVANHRCHGLSRDRNVHVPVIPRATCTPSACLCLVVPMRSIQGMLTNSLVP